MSKSLPCSREVPSTAEPPLDLTQSCLAGMSGSFQQTPWAESPSGCAAQAPSPCCALCACAQGWAGPSAQLQGCTWALLSLDNVENHVLPWPLNKAQTLSSSISLPLSPAGSLLPGSWHCLELQDYSSHPQIHLQGDQTPFMPHFFSLGTPRHFLPTTGINIFLVSVPQQKGSVLMSLPKHSLSSRKIPRKVVAAGQGAAGSILGALPLNSPLKVSS